MKKVIGSYFYNLYGYFLMLLLAQYTEGNGVGLGKLFDKIKINVEDYSDVIETIAKTSLGDILDGDRISVEKLSKAIGTSDSIILGYVQTLKNTSGNVDLTTASMEGLSAYLKKSGNMFNFAAVKATLLNTALNAGIFLAASLATQGIAKALDNSIHKAEKAKERTDELFDEFMQMNDTLADHRKTVSELADRYDELSKGVNSTDNSKISLSDEEYSEFLNINKQLVNIFPELYDGLGRNGSYILNIGTNAQSASKYLQELINKEEYLNNISAANNLDELFKNVSIQVEDSNNKIFQLNEELNGLNGTWKSAEAMNADGFLALDTLEIGDNPELVNAVSRSIQQLQDELYEQFQNNKIGADEYSNFVEQFVNPALYSRATLFDGYVNLASLDRTQKERLQVIIEQQTKGLMGKLEDSTSTVMGNIALEEQNTDAIWADFIPNLIAGMKSQANFQKLDDVGLGDFAISLVEQLDADIINELKGTVYENDIYGYVRDKILVPIQNAITDENGNINVQNLEIIKKQISDALNLKDAFHKNDAPVFNYAGQINGLISVLESLSMTSDIIKYVKVIFNYDEANELKKKLSNGGQSIIVDDWVDTLTQQEIKLANSTDFSEALERQKEKSNDAILSAENYSAALEEVKAKQNNMDDSDAGISPLSISDTIDQLNTRLKPSFDALKSAYQDIFTGSKFTPENVDLSMLDSIKSKLDEMSNPEGLNLDVDYSAFEDLVNVLNNAESTEQDVENAFGHLAASVTQAALSGTEDFETMKAALENLGIGNSNMVAFDALASNTEMLEEALTQANVSMDDFIVNAEEGSVEATSAGQGFLEEKVGAENCAAALYMLAFHKQICNEQGMNTAGEVANLLTLAENAGYTGEVIGHLTELEQIYQEVESGTLNPYQLEKKLARAEELEALVKESAGKIKYEPKINFDDMTKSAGSAKNAASEAKDAAEELGSGLDSLQSAYGTLKDATDEYNRNGHISMETARKLCEVDFRYAAMLDGENGRLSVNAQKFREVTAAKLGEMKTSLARKALDVIKSLATEAEATEYLASANRDLASSLGGVTEAELEAAYQSALAKGGASPKRRKPPWRATGTWPPLTSSSASLPSRALRVSSTLERAGFFRPCFIKPPFNCIMLSDIAPCPL